MEKETKRVAIIWFGEIPKDKEYRGVDLVWNTGGASGDFLDHVDLIDTDRIRYGAPKEGDIYLSQFLCELTKADFDFNGEYHTIIDPPEPQETVEDVLKRR